MEDFPRITRLASNVYAYEDLNGDLDGNLAFTTNSILFLGRAHTAGDLQVYLPREEILFMSETFFNRLYPSVGGSRSA